MSHILAVFLLLPLPGHVNHRYFLLQSIFANGVIKLRSIALRFFGRKQRLPA